MGLDTVRYKTPYMARAIVDLIKDQGESYCRISNETGERIWEITRTNLNGTFDSRIMVKPMYEDCSKSKSGKPEWHVSPPYLVIECSLGKVFYGHNALMATPNCSTYGQSNCSRQDEGIMAIQWWWRCVMRPPSVGNFCPRTPTWSIGA